MRTFKHIPPIISKRPERCNGNTETFEIIGESGDALFPYKARCTINGEIQHIRLYSDIGKSYWKEVPDR